MNSKPPNIEPASPGDSVLRKRKRPRYVKPDAVKELERLATEQARREHPNTPAHVIAPRTFRDDTANGLTACIVAYLKLKNAFVSRLNNTGIFDHKLKRYRPGTNRKGLPDILSTYQGQSLFIEVKAGRDKLSEHQEKIRQEQQESGGIYYTARNFKDFERMDG
ncbi:MAG: VRR-NUC domain-containing protein [Bacteroidales bacterium]|nr:VRR-NUC domain-containing protein [Bacteroidales bacterium]